MPKVSRKPKVLLVGWDAADWQLINPLLKSGKMPALSRLLHNGAFGNLVTLDPPISPMLWTSIATGKYPHKHGIHGFTELAPDGKTIRPVRVTSRKSKAIWNILNDRGLKTNVVGWWPSHPAEDLNGVCVSNFFATASENEDWPLIENAVFPKKWEQTLANLRVNPKELTPEILRNFFPDAEVLDAAESGILRSVMRILAHATSVHAAATEVMEKTDWDFMAVYYDALDHFCHVGMSFHPPQMAHISDEDFKKYHYIVEAAYRFHDMMLERLMDLAGEDCQIFLVSDHGFVNDEKRLKHLPDTPGAPALEHRAYGVFAAGGPHIKSGQIYGASLLDVAPTILNMFNVEIGKDFDGQLLDCCKLNQNIKYIDTHESDSSTSFLPEKPAQVDQQMLSDLAALGYIDLPQNEHEKKVLLSENQFYLARSFAHAGEFLKAEQILKKLTGARPENERYQRFFATLLLRQGKLADLQKWLEKMPSSSFTNFANGLLALQKGQATVASEFFKNVPNAMALRIAMAWKQFGHAQKTAEFLEKALNFDGENLQALNLKSLILFEEEQWQPSLETCFKSLSLLYYQPQIHLRVAQIFMALELWQEAKSALEVTLQLSPQNALAISVYNELVAGILKQPEWAVEVKKIKPAIVVSGFPRSGTSMMMQMLEAAKIRILTDQKRAADKHNPHGYFELEAVKNTVADQKYLQRAEGKAIKIVMPLLRFVHPIFPLKVIWMTREMDKMHRSQTVMKGEKARSFSFAEAQKWQRESELMEQWLNRQHNVEYIKVSYEEALANPEKIANQVARFVEKPTQASAMASVINSSK